MVTASEARKSSEEGKSAYDAGRLESAAELFRAAAQSYAALSDPVNAAEQKNNLSVALLRVGRAQEALDAARGTDDVFARAGDLKRQGMAVNNQAAALEKLHRLDDSLTAYDTSAQLLADAGEGELRAIVLQSAAALQLRRGKVADAGIRMIGVLESRKHPSLFERVLKALLRVIQR